jgi:hypothetical protein
LLLGIILEQIPDEAGNAEENYDWKEFQANLGRKTIKSACGIILKR